MRSQHFSANRWLIFAPVAILALFAQPAKADVTGLYARYYTVDEIPPIQSDNAYPLCGEEQENNINRSFDGEPFLPCGDDLFMVHYQGFVQIPAHDTIKFWVASDDGGTVKIGTHEFGAWQDQGCSATETSEIQLDAGTQTLDAWFYENGGGTCFMLAWNIDDQGWEIVPDEAYTTEEIPTDTTVPDTTVPADTTTSTETTIWESTTTYTTSTTSTSITAPSTTVTATSAPITTTLQTTTTEAAPPQTTTTEAAAPQTTENPTSTTQPSSPSTDAPPDTTVLDTPTVETEPPPTETSIAEVETTTTTETPQTETTTTETSVYSSPTTDAVPVPEEEDQPITAAVFAAAIDELDTATPAEVVAVIEALLAYKLTSDQATELVTSPAVLAAVDEQQAHELFAQVDIENIDATVLAILVAVVQDAPVEVRTAFEDEINIFGGQVDTYVPLGSVVTVGVRRTLVAATATLSVMAAPTVAARKDTNVGIPKR